VADLDANLSPTLVAIDLTKNDIGTVKYNIRDAKSQKDSKTERSRLDDLAKNSFSHTST